jgi:hypothetical protein
MKIIPTLVLFLSLSISALAQQKTADSAETARLAAYRSGVADALAAYQSGDYARSAELYADAFTHVRKQTPVDLYNAACSAALAGRVTRAYGFLHLAIERGWEDEAHMDADADLAALRAYPELWQQVHASFKRELAKRYGPEFDADLRAELLRIGAADQKPRQTLQEMQKKYGWPIPDSIMRPIARDMNLVDSVNIIRIREILDRHGWPKRKAVGMQASQTVFLVIQHADLATQEKYLPMMEKAVKDGDAEPSSLALLVDRIRMRNGKPQLYGSQLHQDEATKKMVFYPIEDEAHVDERRAAMGLEPLAEYAKRFGLTYTPVRTSSK